MLTLLSLYKPTANTTGMLVAKSYCCIDLRVYIMLCTYLISVLEPWCETARWITWEADTETDWSTKPGFAAWKDEQYAGNNRARVNQSEARQQCQQCGADLTSVVNVQEHTFITRHL